jgi:tetratricopeptide (TPR) repeat protein
MASLWNRARFSFPRLKLARLSAAKARVSRRSAREKLTASQRFVHVWQGFVRVCLAMATFWKELAAVVLSVVSVCAVAIILVLLWQVLTKTTIAIAPISVPKILAESGYTADVVAQRLQDALNNVVKDARTSKQVPVVALQADLPSIVVPTIGLSLETVAADIRTFFHIPGRWNISGEFTIAQKQLWLRLRMNGRDFFTSPNGVGLERPDELLAPAAEKVFELADPYIAAASLADRDPGKCLEVAKGIIASRPEMDPSVPWAHVLVSYVLIAQHKTEEAIAEYRKAIELDPRDADPHKNLAIILRAQGKTKEADAEDQKAKELGAKHPD